MFDPARHFACSNHPRHPQECRDMTSLSIVWGLMAPFAMMALGTAPQVDTLDQSPPTAIEQALVERACSGVAAGRTFETDPHAQCLGAQLVSLRSDFGRDLRRLSAS